MRDESQIKLVPVRAFSGGTARVDAELAQNILAAEGVECVLSCDIAAGAILGLQVQLLVREDDAERAAELLEAYFDTAAGSVAPED